MLARTHVALVEFLLLLGFLEVHELAPVFVDELLERFAVPVTAAPLLHIRLHRLLGDLDFLLEPLDDAAELTREGVQIR